jgi:oxazoline/thiazoline dehydrogenase
MATSVNKAKFVLGYRFSEGHKIQTGRGGFLVSAADGQTQVPASESLTAILAPLQQGRVVGEWVIAHACATNGKQAPGELAAVLDRLAKLGVLHRVVADDTGLRAVVEPISERYQLNEVPEPRLDRQLRLSRFAYMRTDGSTTVVESPLCHARVRLLDPRMAAVLADLARAYSIGELLQRHAACGDCLGPILALLITEGFIAPITEQGEAVVDNTPALRQWEFHDLMFHSRSRFGRHRNPMGGTFRFRGEIAPLPAVKSFTGAARIPLVRSDLNRLAAMDVSLTSAIERRASVRRYGAAAITLEELGDFLYRVARVRNRATVADVELTNRPYPNGGASYELELYLIVNQCRGLLPGLFHYEPGEHALEALTPANRLTEQFLNDAWIFCGGQTRPEVLIVIAARFQRVSWKYAGIAYATILKNVGALYQTMYLVATAMGLGPCALGSGDSDRFSQLLGEDYYTETAVGEFMLGNLRTEP